MTIAQILINVQHFLLAHKRHVQREASGKRAIKASFPFLKEKRCRVVE